MSKKKKKESTVEPWQWGDEKEVKKEPDEGTPTRTYTNVADLIRDQEADEIRRLEEFFLNHPR